MYAGSKAFDYIKGFKGASGTDYDEWLNYMSPEDTKKYLQWNEQVKVGWSTEQRYNYQVYGNPDGADAYKINIVTNHTISISGEPNTITRKLDAEGNILQDRIYGSDGKVIKDIDYFHNEKPGSHFFPHEHLWDWTKRNPRVRR